MSAGCPDAGDSSRADGNRRGDADTPMEEERWTSRQKLAQLPIRPSGLNRLYGLAIGPDDLDLVDDLDNSIHVGNRLLGNLLVKESR